MNKLTCCAISLEALEVMCPEANGAIPATWFNWVGQRSELLGYNISRLLLAYDLGSRRPWDKRKIKLWEAECRKHGFDTRLIATDSEEMSGIRLFDLDDIENSVHPEMGRSIIGSQIADREENTELLQALSRPDAYLELAFAAVRRGGGRDLALRGYSNLHPHHWWVWACEYERWLRAASSSTESGDGRAPLTEWKLFSKLYGPSYQSEDTVLDATFFFVEAYSKGLAALKDYDSPEKAWCKDNVTGFEDWRLDGAALKAVYPVRSLPFCGVAETLKGELKPYGGFASLTEPWAWDAKEEVRGAIQAHIRART